MLSVDENTPMSAIPNTGTWYSGAVNTTKYFDISIAGRCDTSASDRVKLDVQSASQIPSFFTKNEAGKIVFAEPQIVGTIKAAKGHNSWVKIELKTVNGNLTSNVAKHVCLGIRRAGKGDFLDIIHAGNLVSKYVNVVRESCIELVPLLSKTATTASTKYVAVTSGSEIAFTDITVPTTGEFNFNSVYRVNVSLREEPLLVKTIKAASGRNSWVQIKLESVSGSITSDAAKHIYFGIKKNDEDYFSDIIHAENLTSKYIDVTQDSYIELTLLSNKMGADEINGSDEAIPSDWSFSNITVPTTSGSYNFCSLYKLNISIHNGQWLTGLTHNARVDENTVHWNNMGRIGVGPVTDQKGIVHENQMFAITQGGILSYSSNGESWIENGTIGQGGAFTAGLRYGNGIWCAISNNNQGVRRSVDGGRTWSKISVNVASHNLDFGNGAFLTVCIDGTVYSSPNAETWTRIGQVDAKNSPFLIYGDNKWICGSDGHVYYSVDGKGTWSLLGDSSSQDVCAGGYGGCYVNKNFYAVHSNGVVVKSVDGKKWTKVFSFSGINNQNVTYYKNKLHLFSATTHKYVVGLFNPDGTIYSLEN